MSFSKILVICLYTETVLRTWDTCTWSVYTLLNIMKIPSLNEADYTCIQIRPYSIFSLTCKCSRYMPYSNFIFQFPYSNFKKGCLEQPFFRWNLPYLSKSIETEPSPTESDCKICWELRMNTVFCSRDEWRDVSSGVSVRSDKPNNMRSENWNGRIWVQV